MTKPKAKASPKKNPGTGRFEAKREPYQQQSRKIKASDILAEVRPGVNMSLPDLQSFVAEQCRLANKFHDESAKKEDDTCEKSCPPPSISKAEKCDIKAKAQPHFTLLAQDNFTPVLIGEWIKMAIAKGTPREIVEDAKRLLANIEEWRRQHPLVCKTPD